MRYLGVILIGLILSSSVLASVQSRGVITQLEFSQGLVEVDGKPYKLDLNTVKVIYDEQQMSWSVLDTQFFVRFAYDPNTMQVDTIWLIGPEKNIQQLFNH